MISDGELITGEGTVVASADRREDVWGARREVHARQGT